MKREEWIYKKRNYHSSISDIISAVAKDSLKDFSKDEARLLLNWNKIFDRELASKIKLKKISYAKTGNVLHLDVLRQYMLEVEYQKGVIVEQISMYFGYKFIDKIKFFPSDEIKENKQKTSKKAVESAQKITIDISDSKIKNEQLRDALKALSKNI
jgi:hypothetical protein